MTTRQQRVVLAMIVLVTLVEYGHRQLLALALVPIGVDLGVSDTALGALLTAFGAVYATAALLLGRLADRTSRRLVLAGGAAVFSLMTALGAAAGSYSLLLMTRFGVGAGQAGVAPSGTALLADSFPPERRATVLGLVAMAAPAGIVLALVVGGFAIEAFGWRPTFVAAGAIGLAVALAFALLVHEPPRGFSEGGTGAPQATPGLRQVLRHLLGFRSFRHVLVGTSLSSLAAITVAQWAPGFLHRVHALSIREAGIAFAAGSLASTLGAALSGAWSDRWGSRDARWYAWVPAIGSLLAAPLHGVAFLWPGATGAALWLVPALTFAMFFGPASTAAVQALAPIAMRATAGAVLVSTLILVGMGVGPLAAGVVSDLLRESAGEDSLRYALCGVSGVYAWSALHFFAAARTLRADLSASRAAGRPEPLSWPG